MPGLDRRGPDGEGPMTGRGLGRCSGNVKESDQNNDVPLAGRGLGRGWRFRGGAGRGRGRGMGRGRFWGRGPVQES